MADVTRRCHFLRIGPLWSVSVIAMFRQVLVAAVLVTRTSIHDESNFLDTRSMHRRQYLLDAAVSCAHIGLNVNPSFGSAENTLSDRCWQVLRGDPIRCEPNLTITRDCDH